MCLVIRICLYITIHTTIVLWYIVQKSFVYRELRLSKTIFPAQSTNDFFRNFLKPHKMDILGTHPSDPYKSPNLGRTPKITERDPLFPKSDPPRVTSMFPSYQQPVDKSVDNFFR